jgi:hypothetical protein
MCTEEGGSRLLRKLATDYHDPEDSNLNIHQFENSQTFFPISMCMHTSLPYQQCLLLCISAVRFSFFVRYYTGFIPLNVCVGPNGARDETRVCFTKQQKQTKNKLRGLNPRANSTDRETSACRRSYCQLLRIEGCRVVSAVDPLRP